MDARHLDSLVRLLAAADTRRRVLALLATVPLLGGLPGALAPDGAAAARKRKAPVAAQRRHGGRKHKHKRKRKTCTPQTTAQTCAGRCGNVTNNCQQPVACPSTCANPTPVCANTTCVACERNSQCASGAICDDGQCAACDVCPGGSCAFTSVQAAINATPLLSTIHVCPGTYLEQAGPTGAVQIARALRLVGAGSGENDARSTILKPAQSDVPVVLVGSAQGVTLQGLRITGGTGANGRGAQIYDSRVDLNGCIIAQNVTDAPGGGFSIAVAGTQVTLTDTLVIGNTGNSAGGVDVQGAGSSLTLDALSRITGNTATGGNGGIRAIPNTSVTLPDANNVTNNTSFGAEKTCGGGGSFTGPGAVCTTT